MRASGNNLTMKKASLHKPVLVNEVVKYLNLAPGKNVIDCTFGGGGHGLEILKCIRPDGKLLAIDADKSTGTLEHWNIGTYKNLIFVQNNFKNLKKIVKQNFSYKVNGILLDLGLSSDQLEKSGRGFSFQKDEPLDMRYDTAQELTAAQVINSYSLENLYDVFKNYGEYPRAHLLAKSIFKRRKKKKFLTTKDLVDVILEINKPARKKIHPATLVFQALRIEVNDELESLKKVLPQAIDILEKRGRLAVISFHSLEDRIVKNYFRDLGREKKPQIKLLTKKPVRSQRQEVAENPRSRSAKLRSIEKL